MIFLGIDSGTQSTKVIAMDWGTGAILADARESYKFIPNLPEGSMEQNPEDWTVALEKCLDSVFAALGSRGKEVAGMGVSGQQHGLVVLDGKDEVVRPAKLWCDTSTAGECVEISSHFGGKEAVINLVGNAMLPGYTASKILWLRKNEPENWKRTRSILLPHDYLNLWLTGKKRMEYGDASGTALLNIRRRTWSIEMMNFIAPELQDRLPEIGASSSVHGHLRKDLCERWSLTNAPIVSAGGGDNMMGAIGTGNVSPGIVTASLGTSGTLYAFSADPVVDPEGEVAGFCDSTDHWLPLVCTMNVTLVTELVREIFSLDHRSYDELAESIRPGSDGLLLLPYLTGERTPNLPKGCGVLHGINAKNFGKAHLARAAMEGVTLGLGYGMERLKTLGIHPSQIRLTGGGTNSRLWRQICADVFAVPTICLKSSEGAAIGAAIHAAWCQQREENPSVELSEITSRLIEVDNTTLTEPNADSVSIYREALHRTNGLRQCLHSEGAL